jgi:hypothetical protein
MDWMRYQYEAGEKLNQVNYTAGQLSNAAITCIREQALPMIGVSPWEVEFWSLGFMSHGKDNRGSFNAGSTKIYFDNPLTLSHINIWIPYKKLVIFSPRLEKVYRSEEEQLAFFNEHSSNPKKHSSVDFFMEKWLGRKKQLDRIGSNRDAVISELTRYLCSMRGGPNEVEAMRVAEAVISKEISLNCFSETSKAYHYYEVVAGEWRRAQLTKKFS